MIKGVVSDSKEITCGVPQCDLLASLLYLCCNNDMESSVLIVSDRDSNIVSRKLKSDLESCNQWFTANKLSMHVGKTECILFGSKRNINKVKQTQN